MKKYKTGQKVSLLEDLTQELEVMSVYEQHAQCTITGEFHIYSNDGKLSKKSIIKYTLSNDKAYREEELVEYNPAIQRLEEKVKKMKGDMEKSKRKDFGNAPKDFGTAYAVNDYNGEAVNDKKENWFKRLIK